ncbi:hypothetical protein BT93_G2231 [Corymbia citriodora subsp. variegata]|nr:hypothetical protein BT93_G2231 [Corymbia citriodora subsp. variegata]
MAKDIFVRRHFSSFRFSSSFCPGHSDHLIPCRVECSSSWPDFLSFSCTNLTRAFWRALKHRQMNPSLSFSLDPMDIPLEAVATEVLRWQDDVPFAPYLSILSECYRATEEWPRKVTRKDKPLRLSVVVGH